MDPLWNNSLETVCWDELTTTVHFTSFSTILWFQALQSCKKHHKLLPKNFMIGLQGAQQRPDCCISIIGWVTCDDITCQDKTAVLKWVEMREVMIISLFIKIWNKNYLGPIHFPKELKQKFEGLDFHLVKCFERAHCSPQSNPLSQFFFPSKI